MNTYYLKPQRRKMQKLTGVGLLVAGIAVLGFLVFLFFTVSNKLYAIFGLLAIGGLILRMRILNVGLELLTGNVALTIDQEGIKFTGWKQAINWSQIGQAKIIRKKEGTAVKTTQLVFYGKPSGELAIVEDFDSFDKIDEIKEQIGRQLGQSVEEEVIKEKTIRLVGVSGDAHGITIALQTANAHDTEVSTRNSGVF
jgi:hypothetical protein